MDYPYVENGDTANVLETEDPARMSTDDWYPYVQYHGQGVDFIHGNDLDDTFYNVSIMCSHISCPAQTGPG